MCVSDIVGSPYFSANQS